MVTGAAAPAASPALAGSVGVRGLGKAYPGQDGAVVALEGVDLEAGPGEIVGVIGPSGCGKSTLLAVVAGLEGASAGEVLLDGAPASARVGRVALMPQRDLLLEWRTVVDNVGLPLELTGVRRAEARERVTPLLERFGLAGFATARPWQLSGGMRQRAAFLRTVVQGRRAMLLDEPFGALDDLTRADLQRWLLDVWEEVRTTILLVTHDVAEAVVLCDRVYVMTPRPGRVSAVVDVDLPRPRPPDVELAEGFGALERRLRLELRSAAS
jgi:ABC-type nitrate/sulfonate/bicarbonate transport system ATPase subunit